MRNPSSRTWNHIYDPRYARKEREGRKGGLEPASGDSNAEYRVYVDRQEEAREKREVRETGNP